MFLNSEVIYRFAMRVERIIQLRWKLLETHRFLDPLWFLWVVHPGKRGRSRNHSKDFVKVYEEDAKMVGVIEQVDAMVGNAVVIEQAL